MDAFLNWLAEYNVAIFLFVIAVVGCVNIALRLSKYMQRLETCENEISGLKTDVQNLRTDIGDMRADVEQVRTYLALKDNKFMSLYSEKKSPRVLNEAGKRLYDLIGGDEFLQANKSMLFERLDAKELRTALDVETFAIVLLNDLKDDPIFDNIKRIIYNAPATEIQNEDGTTSTHEHGIGDACFVLSLPLRDMYLDEHPTIQ